MSLSLSVAVRWEQFVPRGRQLEWAEVHADSLYQRRGQLWAVTAKGQLYGGHGHDGDLQVRNCCLKGEDLPVSRGRL